MKAHLDAVTPNNPYVSPYAYPVPYVGLTGDEYATQQSKKKKTTPRTRTTNNSSYGIVTEKNTQFVYFRTSHFHNL